MVLTPTMLAIGGVIYNCLRVGFVMTVLCLNLILIHRISKNRQHNRSCTGCRILRSITIVNVLEGWIWTGTVIYSMNDGQSFFLENIICSLESSCVQLVSYFLLATMACICVHNVRRAGPSKFWLTWMPPIYTVALYALARIITNGDMGTFTGFYKLGSVDSTDGRFGADFELMMCAQHLYSDRFMIGFQYVLIVAPLAVVITVCTGILAVRARSEPDDRCTLEVLHVPIEEKTLPVVTKHEEAVTGEKAALKSLMTDLDEQQTTPNTDTCCTYSGVKSAIGMTLLLNLLWQAVVRPFMISNAFNSGNSFYVDIGTNIIVGIQASYLPLHAIFY